MRKMKKKLLQINARNYNAAPLKPIPEYPQPNDTKRRKRGNK